MSNPTVDGVLVQWGDLLFYPGIRIVKPRRLPRLMGTFAQQRARWVRQRIEAIVVRRAPQVMVKVTGGGRGMRAIAAHFRYISKNGRLELEDDRDNKREGREALRELVEEWRLGGSLIPERADRREAFNIMLSMPRGTDPTTVLSAARAFAKGEFTDHAYVMVLHDHQANPHVHLSVRAESRHGERLNPRRGDLHRWRETFAERLRELGIDAEATRQAARGLAKHYDSLWQVTAREQGRLRQPRSEWKLTPRNIENRKQVGEAWVNIAVALDKSPDPTDRALAQAIVRYGRELRESRERGRGASTILKPVRPEQVRPSQREGPERSGPEMTR